ncbi:hypothetical protein SNEBB_010233 [Seison nebaliae]|nr:hypothetical protein SNEBB_010233 [Seison nebaliae]
MINFISSKITEKCLIAGKMEQGWDAQKGTFFENDSEKKYRLKDTCLWWAENQPNWNVYPSVKYLAVWNNELYDTRLKTSVNKYSCSMCQWKKIEYVVERNNDNKRRQRSIIGVGLLFDNVPPNVLMDHQACYDAPDRVADEVTYTVI